MLGKLLKYDLKWCFKPLILFYILAFIFSVIIRVVENMEQSLMVVIIDKICVGIISIFISIVINCFMRNWARFIRNVYKDESYLTHTLPVSKNSIYFSKFLAISITLFVSILVIIMSLAIACLTEDTWMYLKNSLEESAVYFNSSVFSIITVVIATLFFELLFLSMSGILGIIIGYRSNNYKNLKSIAFGLGIYTILSSLTLGIVYCIGYINSDIMAIFNNLNVGSETIKGIMLIAVIIYAIYIIAEYFVGRKLLNKGVNVD